MNSITVSSQARRTSANQRARLLAEFDRGGLSGAAFARKHQINYTTFCGWRQQRDKTHASPGFVQLELPTPGAPTQLIVQIGPDIRLSIGSAAQIELAAAFLAKVRKELAC